MIDLDDALAQLRNLPIDPRLAQIDAVVLGGLDKYRTARSGPSSAQCIWAASMALMVGIASAVLPEAPTHDDLPSLVSGPLALAPSTLLAGSL